MKKLNIKKANKYQYIKVIQQYFATRWEDVSEYECNSQFLTIEKSGKLDKKGKETSLLSEDLKEYKIMGYPTRVIKRKVLNNQNN